MFGYFVLGDVRVLAVEILRLLQLLNIPFSEFGTLTAVLTNRSDPSAGS